MDDDIREKMESSIRHYREDIELLRNMETIKYHVTGDYGIYQHMCKCMPDRFEALRPELIEQLEHKIEAAVEDAEEKQRRRDIAQAQSDAYDNWRKNQ